MPLLLLSGCIGIFDYHYEKQVSGKYYLSAIDGREFMSLAYDLGGGSYVDVVHPIVFAAGVNHGYVFVKRHPPSKPDVAEYWAIADTVTKYNTDRYVMGPFTQQQFAKKVVDLGIRDTTFSIVLKDLQ